MSYTVRLELDYLKISRKRERWNLYFLVSTEDPEDATKSVVTVVPQAPILMRSLDKNDLQFEAKGGGDPNGLIVLECPMPADKTLRVRIWIVQSHDKLRNAGEVLQKLSAKFGGNKSTKITTKILGSANPWLKVGKDALSLMTPIGELLSEIKDKKKGFVSLDEGFSAQEIEEGEVDRSGQISSFGELGWTWVIDPK